MSRVNEMLVEAKRVLQYGYNPFTPGFFEVWDPTPEEEYHLMRTVDLALNIMAVVIAMDKAPFRGQGGQTARMILEEAIENQLQEASSVL